MKNQLIPVFTGVINTEQSQLVNARELHQFLEVNTQFKDWINRRISEYQFIENNDFISIAQKRAIGHGRGKIDYHLTLDMAKELSMVERTEKGRQARKYFIECEKRLMQPTKPKLTNKKSNEITHRYLVEVNITDFLTKGKLQLLGKCNDFNALITHVARELGYKINSMSVNNDGLKATLNK